MFDIVEYIIGSKHSNLKPHSNGLVYSNGVNQPISLMNAMSFGLLSILHDRIFQACMYFITKGEITADELENLEYLYKGYSGMGGNGTCETLYNRVKALKIVN